MRRRFLVINCYVFEGCAKSHADWRFYHLASKANAKLEIYSVLSQNLINRLKSKPDIRGVILTGSARIHPTDDSEELPGIGTSGPLNQTVLEVLHFCAKNQIPVFGICYGHQMIARYAGEDVVQLPDYELGFKPVTLTFTGQSNHFVSSVDRTPVAQYHGFGLVSPRYSIVLAENEACVQAIRVEGSLTGVQFHPDFLRDGDGLGTFEYLYSMDLTLRRLASQVLLIPPNIEQTYSGNNIPLLRFLSI